jgi:hypothetical protein
MVFPRLTSFSTSRPPHKLLHCPPVFVSSRHHGSVSALKFQSGAEERRVEGDHADKGAIRGCDFEGAAGVCIRKPAVVEAHQVACC